MAPIPFVDLFCGAGGLSVGFERAGFEAVFANDIDVFAAESYSKNHKSAKVFTGDVQELSGRDILDETGLSHIPLVVGGPNCQGVSLRGKRDPNDPKNRMFFHFKRLISELEPDWFVMENVPGLLHRHNRELLSSIFASFEEIGYQCGGEVLLAADYGVPQLRYRFVLIGNKHGAGIRFPSATHRCPLALEEAELFTSQLFDSEESNVPGWITVADAISDLPALDNGGGEECRSYPSSPDGLTDFQVSSRKGAKQLWNHVSHKSPDSNISLIKHIAPGKNWKAIPEALRPARFKHVALKDHTTTYGRLRWDMPARTVTTYFNNISAGAFTHPDQHRGISVREGARLQSFPDRFRFFGPLSRQYRQVGNAVPPMLAYHVARQVARDLKGLRTSNDKAHAAAVEFDRRQGLRIVRPLKGMRFNLDRYLVRT